MLKSVTMGITIKGVTRGSKCGTIPGRRITSRAPKCPQNVTSTFFYTVHLLPKKLRSEHGGGRLASCPRRHLTSLCPWLQLQQMIHTSYLSCSIIASSLRSGLSTRTIPTTEVGEKRSCELCVADSARLGRSAVKCMLCGGGGGSISNKHIHTFR